MHCSSEEQAVVLGVANGELVSQPISALSVRRSAQSKANKDGKSQSQERDHDDAQKANDSPATR